MSAFISLKNTLSAYSSNAGNKENFKIRVAPEGYDIYYGVYDMEYYHNPTPTWEIPHFIITAIKEEGTQVEAVEKLLQESPVDTMSLAVSTFGPSCSNWLEWLPLYLTTHYFDDGEDPVAIECAEVLQLTLPGFTLIE